MTTDYVLVTTTTDSAERAAAIAEAIVKQRLAACAHIEETDAAYWWQGEFETAHEWRVEYKTTRTRLEQLKAEVLRLHTYTTPQLIVTPILDGSPAYLEWLTAETTPR